MHTPAPTDLQLQHHQPSQGTGSHKVTQRCEFNMIHRSVDIAIVMDCWVETPYVSV